MRQSLPAGRALSKKSRARIPTYAGMLCEALSEHLWSEVREFWEQKAPVGV